MLLIKKNVTFDNYFLNCATFSVVHFVIFPAGATNFDAAINTAAPRKTTSCSTTALSGVALFHRRLLLLVLVLIGTGNHLSSLVGLTLRWIPTAIGHGLVRIRIQRRLSCYSLVRHCRLWQKNVMLFFINTSEAEVRHFLKHLIKFRHMMLKHFIKRDN